MRDYRLWWALFVFFAVLSVLAVQYRYRQWRRAGALLGASTGQERVRQARRVRLEGWRLVLMTTSLLAMTGLVFAAFLAAPPALLLALRILAVTSVFGVLVVSLRL